MICDSAKTYPRSYKLQLLYYINEPFLQEWIEKTCNVVGIHSQFGISGYLMQSRLLDKMVAGLMIKAMASMIDKCC